MLDNINRFVAEYQPNNIVALPLHERLATDINPDEHVKSNEVYALKRAEDVRALQEYFLQRGQYRNWLYVAIGVNVGLRGSDLGKLRWGDVIDSSGKILDYTDNIIRERKTKKLRRLFFNDDAQKAVDFYLETTGIKPDFTNPDNPDYWVFKKDKFSGNNDLFISRVAMGRILKNAAAQIGIKYHIGTHTLRKTFGYRLYKAGTPIEYIQYLLNHASPATTLRYIGIMQEDVAKLLGDLDSVLAILDAKDED